MAMYEAALMTECRLPDSAEGAAGLRRCDVSIVANIPLPCG